MEGSWEHKAIVRGYEEGILETGEAYDEMDSSEAESGSRNQVVRLKERTQHSASH